MKVPENATSRPDHIVCPGCENGRLRPKPYSLLMAECEDCGRTVDRALYRTLKQIATLGEALGEHACEECGHPEMRRTPDGVFTCPSCCSEVFPAGGSSYYREEPSGESVIYTLEQKAAPEPVLDTVLELLRRWAGFWDRTGGMDK